MLVLVKIGVIMLMVKLLNLLNLLVTSFHILAYGYLLVVPMVSL
jgi:hypothetical protein